MISRSHRFHGINSLRHVYARGQTVRGPLIAVKYIFNNKRDSYRAAVVVSRKVHKSAVVRNRIRRRIYEYLRLHEPQLVQPYDIVLTVFSEQVATIDAAALSAMLDEQFERADLFQQPVGPASHAIVEQIAPPEQRRDT
jgi:ribonuclease P protein component